MGPATPIGMPGHAAAAAGHTGAAAGAAAESAQPSKASEVNPRTSVESTRQTSMMALGTSDRPDEQLLRGVAGLALAMQILEMLSGEDKEEDRGDNALALAMLGSLMSQAQGRSAMLFSSTTETTVHNEVAVGVDAVQDAYQSGGPQGTAEPGSGGSVALDA